MTRTLFGLLLLVTALSGCRMCSSVTDYSAPVAGSPHALGHGRAGSVLSGYQTTTLPDASADAVPPPPPPPELAEPPAPPTTY